MTSVRFLMGLRTLADPQPHQRKENPQMTDATSTIVNRTLRRLPNAAYRPREYLTKKEVDRLIEVARQNGRHGARGEGGILLGVGHCLGGEEIFSVPLSTMSLPVLWLEAHCEMRGSA